jgi:hypothetical protein
MEVSDIRECLVDAVRHRLGIDTRTLAAFRVALGVVVFVNLVARTRDLASFYTGSGVLPNAAVQEYTTLSRYSLYALSDSVVYVGFLFAVTAALAVAMVVGYRTRLTSIGVLVLVFSLNARNPLVMNGGDALLTRLLFWSVFLPLGARWSVDARRDSKDVTERVTSLATFALLTQVVVVYVANAVFKLRSGPWMSGEAVPEVFGLTAYTTAVGSFLANFPELLVALNYAWVVLLVSSPLLLVLTGWRRASLAAAFAVCHLGLFVTMNLTVFPLVSVVGLVVFTPSSVWDACARTRLYGPFRRFGDIVDRALPRFRFTNGRSVNLSSDAPFQRWRRRAVSFLVAVCLVTVLVTNASAMGYVETEATEQVEEYVGYKWSLFAPYPPTTDRWYVFHGETASGDVVDPLRLSPYEEDLRPDPYPNARWRKYLGAVRSNDDARIEQALVGYLCQRWNRRNNDGLTGVKGYFVEYDGTADKSTFLRGNCDP